MSLNGNEPSEIRNIEIQDFTYNEEEDEYYILLEINPQSGPSRYYFCSESDLSKLDREVSQTFDEIRKDRRERHFQGRSRP